MGFVQRNLPAILAVVALVLAVLGVFGYFQTQQEVPQRDFTLLTDEVGSGYYRIAEKFKELLAPRGLDLQVRPTTGATETLQKLRAGEAGMALLPGFLTAQLDPTAFSSLGALFDEPLWIFYRKAAFGGDPVRYLTQLEGKRVAVGLPGSGSQELAMQLLTDNGLTRENTSLRELSRQDEVTQMLAGELDAILLLDSYQAETVQKLLRAPEVGLADLAQVEAYAARQHALKVVTLPEGTIDLRNNVPATDVRLLSSAANLVIRNDINATLGRALMTTAVTLFSAGDFFAAAYTYPNLTATDLPVLNEYVDYFNRLKSGSLLFTNKLSFWAEYSVERFIFFLLPFLLLLGLSIFYFPALWRWYMHGKLLPSYKVLRAIEVDLPEMDVTATEEAIARMTKLEANVTQRVRVSAAYLPEIFLLRSHIRSVLVDLMRHKKELDTSAGPHNAVNQGDHPGEE